LFEDSRKEFLKNSKKYRKINLLIRTFKDK
jgi:hypothetical protein